ncbi:synaptotagmin-5 [Heracleum sosnowskyi]|uniref:Synaptotagmin-5 n=1 Tax=Heracleum sosnowskyi TaxID=360622 RepID=A0AAD8HT85_9APIA|nr:synaptotagmin-5 [Heracleum sosnowskyi]
MGRRKRSFEFNDCLEFVNKLMVEKPFIVFVIPLVLACWSVEKWVFSLSNWVPLVVAVWATFQYASHQRQNLVEDMNRKWKQVVLQTSPLTPLEHCEWLNKLLIEIWPEYICPKLSIRFSSIVEKRLKQRKSRLIEKIELQAFSLGSCPPTLGINGTRWSTLGDQRIMHLGFDWDTTDMSIMLLAKLAKPLLGAARIVINSIHIKGDLLLMPVLDGKAVLYSFLSTPQVRIGVAFGSGGSQSLPATELPGVSSWLVKIITDSLVKTMVEPRRRCFSLPAVELRKKAVGGILYVTVVSANKLSKINLKGSPNRGQQSVKGTHVMEHLDDKDMLTFVEVELGDLSRKTGVREGTSPKWGSTFNMVLHEDTGTLRLNLYECKSGSVKYDYLTSCEIKMKYVADDSTMFWAVGAESSVIAKHAEFCGKEVELTVPFEGVESGELTVKLVLKEWQYSDGSHSLNNFHLNSRASSLYGSSNFPTRTGRKIYVTIVEGKDLLVKDKSGKCDLYVKLQYGKVQQKTKSKQNTSNPIWNQKFEFDEVGNSEYLKIRFYSEETFGDENLGSARVNLEGLIEGSTRDVWIPLEKVSLGELHLKIEAVNVDDNEGSKSNGGSGNGWLELSLIEGRDLIAADIRGTSDPYVRVQYGNLKRKTKIMYKTLNPKWNQTLEFPDDGSPLELHVKDYNALLPTSNIGDCVVEYQGLPVNQMADRWIPLQGVKRGEIHVQITRRVPEMQKKSSLGGESPSSKSHQISSQMKQMMLKCRSLVDDDNLEELSASLSELESLHDLQEEYAIQLETEQMLLLSKINELGQEIINSSPSLSRRSSD